MSAAANTGRSQWLSAQQINRSRQITGLVLFTYVTTHLLNHACGLISIDAQEAVRVPFLAFWHFLPLTILLYGSIIVHVAIALRAIYRLPTFRVPLWQGLQILLGVALPFLLFEHVIGTRGAMELVGTDPTYSFMMTLLWSAAPAKGIINATALLVAWIHGCIGLHFWLRIKSGYRRIAPYLLVLAVLVPVLSLLGFANAGREAARLLENEEWVARMLEAANQPNAAAVELTANGRLAASIVFALVLAATLLARAIRLHRSARAEKLRVTYPGGRIVEAPLGTSILDVSKMARIPHASVCGGRGRCSTCRVRVTSGLDRIPEPSEHESRVLARVGAPANVRLACQSRPGGDVQVVPVLPQNAHPREAEARPQHLQGEERDIAILFSDLRGFTTFSEEKLPYDVVFVLNRYFAAMGTAIENSGGHVDKFIGDGIMALFGITGTPQEACIAALKAARRMSVELDNLNSELEADLPQPLRMGIGIHAGPVVLGEMGHGRTTSLTAIGDPVNTASRLESMTKEHGAELIVSEDVCKLAGFAADDFLSNSIAVRGRSDPVTVRIIDDIARLRAFDEVRVDQPPTRQAAK